MYVCVYVMYVMYICMYYICMYVCITCVCVCVCIRYGPDGYISSGTRKSEDDNGNLATKQVSLYFTVYLMCA